MKGLIKKGNCIRYKFATLGLGTFNVILLEGRGEGGRGLAQEISQVGGGMSF